MSFLDGLPRPFLVLAPMDDVTDTVFRQIVADCAKPDLFMTEFVNVDGLQSPGRPKLLKKLKVGKKDRPIIAQIWGLEPENFYKTTRELKKMGFAGVDINMGCPIKKIVKNGACAALINNRKLAEQIITATIEAAESSRVTQAVAAQGASEECKGGVREGTSTARHSTQRSDVTESVGGVDDSAGKQASTVREARDFPVSVKTRVGFNTTDLSWLEFLLSQKLDWLSIHGRTAKQLSKVPSNWDLIGEVRKMRDVLCPATLVVGNGDVMNRAQALKLAKKYQLDGVMIGRGVFHDPFTFAATSPWHSWGKQQKLDLFRKHIKLFAKTWPRGEYKFDLLKKFAKIYISGFDGASDLRVKFMQAKDARQAIELL